MKLAMSIGEKRHCRIDDIMGRHFLQTGAKAGLPKSLVHRVIEEVLERGPAAMQEIEAALPANFPEQIHTSVAAAARERLRRMQGAVEATDGTR